MARQARRALALGAAVTLMFVSCTTGPSTGVDGTDTAKPLESPQSVSTAPAASATQGPIDGPTVEPLSSADFWAGIVPGGMNDEHYATLAEMTAAADLVAVGTVVSIGRDPKRHTSLSESDGAFGQLEFVPEQVLAGRVESEGSGIRLEFYVTDPNQLDQFEARLPFEHVLVFLRNKAVEAAANGWPIEGPDTGHLYYRVVSDQGLIRDVGGMAMAPDDGGGFLSDVNKATFDAVVAAVRAAAQ